jgi:hypothetical protein
MNGLRSILLGIALVHASESAAQSQSPPTAAVGCYAVKMGAWEPVVSLGADTIETIPPARIELLADTVTSGRGRGAWIIRPAPGAGASYHRFVSFYRPAPADSLDLTWTTGFSGLRMRVARSGTELVGWAQTFWDFERTRQRAPVRLIREPCQ